MKLNNNDSTFKTSFCLLLLIQCLLWTNSIEVFENTHCEKALSQLATSQANFTYCITKHSVPVNICLQCANQYKIMTEKFSNIANCTDFFDKDRLNLVTKMSTALSDVWSKAYCDDCTSDTAILIRTDNDNLNECLKEHECIECVKGYRDLNILFMQWYRNMSGKVCFEAQDMVNRTRHTWSYKCPRHVSDFTLFIIFVSLIIGVFPVFYLSSYLTLERQQRHNLLNNFDISNEPQAHYSLS